MEHACANTDCRFSKPAIHKDPSLCYKISILINHKEASQIVFKKTRLSFPCSFINYFDVSTDEMAIGYLFLLPAP